MLELFESFMRILGNALDPTEIETRTKWPPASSCYSVVPLLWSCTTHDKAVLRPSHLLLVLLAPLVRKCQHSTGSKNRWTLKKAGTTCWTSSLKVSLDPITVEKLLNTVLAESLATVIACKVSFVLKDWHSKECHGAPSEAKFKKRAAHGDHSVHQPFQRGWRPCSCNWKWNHPAKGFAPRKKMEKRQSMEILKRHSFDRFHVIFVREPRMVCLTCKPTFIQPQIYLPGPYILDIPP